MKFVTVIILVTRAGKLWASNGFRNSVISYNIHPRAQTSDFSS